MGACVWVCVDPYRRTGPLRVPFGEWTPDQPSLVSSQVAKNVIPYATAYGPLNSLESFTDALASACLGSFWAKQSNGTIHNHAGTATTLEALQSDNTWDDVSKALGYANVTSWEWTLYGNRMIAVDLAVNPQYYDMGTSSTYDDLSGSPPKAAHIATIRNFVVLGNVNDGTAYPDRVSWSGYNSTILWTPDRSTQAGRRDLGGKGGKIQRIVPGQTGIVFQERSIWAMAYAGPPTIFTLDEIEAGRGTIAPNSVVYTGGVIYYLGLDGFYRWAGRSEPIGTEKVDRWFFNAVDQSAMDETRGAIDPKNKLVLWAFKSSGSLAYFDRVIIYNWAVNRWSYGEINTEVIADFAAPGFTLDSMDTIVPDIDGSTVSFDSDVYQGGTISLVAFDTAHKTASFSGTDLTAELETIEAGEMRRAAAASVRPLVNGGTVTIANGTRNQQTENYTYSLAKSPNAIGVANFRTMARYHRAKVSISGGFGYAIGVDAEFSPGGAR